MRRVHVERHPLANEVVAVWCLADGPPATTRGVLAREVLAEIVAQGPGGVREVEAFTRFLADALAEFTVQATLCGIIVTLRTPARNFREVFSEVQRAITAPDLGEEMVRSAVEIVARDKTRVAPRSTIIVERLLTKLLWPGHPLARLPEEEASIVATLSGAELRRLHRRLLTGGAALSLCGDIDPTRSADLVARAWNGWLPYRYRPVTRKPPRSGTARTTVVVADGPGYVAIGFPFPGVRSSDHLPARVLVQAIDGPDSPLLQRVRNELGSYVVQAYYPVRRDDGTLVVESSGAASRLLEIAKTLLRSLEEVRETLTPSRIAQARALELTEQALCLDSVEYRALQIATDLCYFGESQTPEETLRRIEAVSDDQVREVAQRYVQANLARTVLFFPESELSRSYPPAPTETG